ncbi:unnamed protein product, partial [Mesorhabditis spiculigera]
MLLLFVIFAAHVLVGNAYRLGETVDPCKVCGFLLQTEIDQHGGAFGTEDDVQNQLLDLCTRLGQIDGSAVLETCDSIVRSHGHQIYQGLMFGSRPQEICVGISACKESSTQAVLRALR